MIQITGINPNVERQVERFETAVAEAPNTNFANFLLAPDHEDYLLVAMELMRVDLELAWERGQHKRLSDYQVVVPQLFDNSDLRTDLAFEEFRARREHGDHVDATEYETRYQVDISTWNRFGNAPAVSALAPDDRRSPSLSNGPPSSLIDLPSLGDDWGPFKILDELGRGSLARTYLATQASLADRPVALKFTTTATMEADNLARLQHSNVVPIYSIHQDDRWLVTCMPYLGRTTLADVISQPELLDEVGQQQGPAARERSVLRLIMALAEGLEHAHSRGILHRDIKPANILLTDDGEPMLLDFNLAIDRNELQSATTAGGTVPYMAPEQLQSLEGKGQVDERSDVYSLGVVLCQLLAGRLPWKVSQADVDTHLDQIVQEREQTRDWKMNASPAAAQIVRKCLLADVDQRYGSAAELATDIRRHLADEPLKYGRNVSLRESLGKWARRHPRICSLTSAVVLLAVGAIAMASAWSARERHLDGVLATESLLAVDGQLAELRPALSTIALHPEDRDQLRVATDELATTAGLDGNSTHVENSLTSDQLSAWQANQSELACLRASLELDAARNEPHDERRAEFIANALRWNQIALQNGSRSVAVQMQRSAIEALADGQAIPALPNTPPVDMLASATDYTLAGLTLLFDQHQPQQAAEQLRRAVKLAPTQPAAWLLLMESALAQEEFSQAEAYAEVALALLPDSPIPLFQRGVARLRSGQYQAAADDFSTVIDLEPDNHRARLNLALALKALGRMRDANTQLTMAIDGGFDDPRAWLIRSRVRQQLENPLAVRSDFEQGLSLPALDVEGRLAQGVALVDRDPQAALLQFEECVRIRPHSRPAWHNLAHVQSEKLGDEEGAIRSLSNALRIDKYDTVALAGRGVLFARRGKKQAALQDAQRLSTLNIDAITEYQLACIYAILAEDSPELESQAIAALASSLRRDPSLIKLVHDDPDLNALTDTDSFQRLMTELSTTAIPASSEQSP